MSIEKINAKTQLDEILSKTSIPTIINFSSQWCIQCKNISSRLIKDISEKYLDRIKILEVDVGDPTLKDIKLEY